MFKLTHKRRRVTEHRLPMERTSMSPSSCQLSTWTRNYGQWVHRGDSLHQIGDVLKNDVSLSQNGSMNTPIALLDSVITSLTWTQCMYMILKNHQKEEPCDRRLDVGILLSSDGSCRGKGSRTRHLRDVLAGCRWCCWTRCSVTSFGNILLHTNAYLDTHTKAITTKSV